MELRNRWADPTLHQIRARLTERLRWWRIRLTDDLPRARYTPRRPSTTGTPRI